MGQTCSRKICGFQTQSKKSSAPKEDTRLYFVLDHPESADIHLCSAIRTVLKDRLSDRLGFHIFPSGREIHVIRVTNQISSIFLQGKYLS
jgi:hypothetical protein